MKKAFITVLSCFFLTAVMPVAAYAQELYVGGQIVGIQISTEGVLVAGIAQIETLDGAQSPAEKAGLKKGDIIMEINGEKVGGAAALVEKVASYDGAAVELGIRRAGKNLKVQIKPVLSDEKQWRMGVWLRDGISGIGTVTYCDPDTGKYGALGHSISDLESGITVPLKDGCISSAEIVSIHKGNCGKPGELNGCADVEKKLGSVENNTAYGIFGSSYVSLGKELMDTGEPRPGKATIISTVSGRQAREYSVEINRIYKDAEGQHLVLTVTDPQLLTLTGGIVQGMSGSPIIQGGKLVGAVTHVFVNDPTKGYGISIDNMLTAAG